MSADRRKKILIVFAGLAVVLVGVIAYVSPNFRSDSVSGAIGAVQKHRQPQIAKQDVILGDEKARQEQKVLYADFLSDAASLRNAAVDVALAARATDAQARLAELAENLEVRADDVEARYAGELKKSLEIIAILIGSESLERKKLDAMRAEVEALGKMAENRSLSAIEMEQLNTRLAAMLKSFHWGSMSEEQLASMSDEQLEARLRSEENLAAARLALKEMEARTAARSNAAMVRSQEIYLQAMAQEAKAVESAKRSIEALASEPTNESRALGVHISKASGLASEELALAAQNLEARAMQNIEMLGSFSAGSEKWIRGQLGSLELELAARKTGSEAELAAFRDDVAAYSKKLQSEAAALEARNVAHMQAQLRAIEFQVNAYEAMNARLASIESSIAAKLRNEEALVAYQKRLEAISAAGSRADLASVLGSQDFAAEVRKVANKAAELQARSR